MRFLFIDSVHLYKEEFDTLCNFQIFTYLLVFHPYYRIRIQRTQSANNHGQLKKYGRTQRTFFMERGREELLVDQCCKYCHFDRWSKFVIWTYWFEKSWNLSNRFILKYRKIPQNVVIWRIFFVQLQTQNTKADSRNMEELKELHGEGGSDVFTSTRHVNPNAVSIVILTW